MRAFGDNIAKWGTGVVLIETGPAPGDDPDRTLIRANFVAIVTALDALASGRVKKADPKRYETLPFNESRLLHTLVTGATLVGNPKLAPYTADIGISGTRIVRRVSAESGGTESGGKRTLGLSARIADLGDLQTSGALNTIDAKGLTAAPLWDENLKQGDEVSLPDWSTWKGPTIAIGRPPNIVLLTPASATASASAAGGASTGGASSLSRGARHPPRRSVAARSEVIPDRRRGALRTHRRRRRRSRAAAAGPRSRSAGGRPPATLPVRRGSRCRSPAGCSNRSSSVRSSPIAANSVVTGSSRTSACSARPCGRRADATSITLLPPMVSTTSPAEHLVDASAQFGGRLDRLERIAHAIVPGQRIAFVFDQRAGRFPGHAFAAAGGRDRASRDSA